MEIVLGSYMSEADKRSSGQNKNSHSKNITNDSILSWFFGFLFAVVGFFYLFFNPILGLVYLAISALLPPLNKLIESKLKLYLPKGVKLILIFVLLFLSAYIEIDKITQDKTIDTTEYTTEIAKINYSILREWKPNQNPNGLGLDILLEDDLEKDELISFIKDLSKGKDPIAINVYISKAAYEQGEEALRQRNSNLLGDEWKRGFLLVYLKSGGLNEIRWMQQVGKFSHLYGKTTKIDSSQINEQKEPKKQTLANKPTTKLTRELVFEARKNFQVEVLSFDAIHGYGEYGSYDYVRVKITNKSTMSLPHLTVKTNRYDKYGKLIAWTRSSIPTGDIEPGESVERDYYPFGHWASTQIIVEIEQEIDEESMQFFKEFE